MTDTKKTTQNNGNGVNSAIAAAVGAVVAGAAVAGAAFMSNKKNQDKVKKVVQNVKDDAVGYVKDVQGQAEVKKEEIKEKVIEQVQKL